MNARRFLDLNAVAEMPLSSKEVKKILDDSVFAWQLTTKRLFSVACRAQKVRAHT